jgi:hypothetical protein
MDFSSHGFLREPTTAPKLNDKHSEISNRAAILTSICVS